MSYRLRNQTYLVILTKNVYFRNRNILKIEAIQKVAGDKNKDNLYLIKILPLTYVARSTVLLHTLDLSFGTGFVKIG